MNVARAGLCTALLPLALLVATPGDALAQQEPSPDARTRRLDVGVTAGASRSDNVARVPEAEEEGTVGQAGLILGYTQRTRRLEADIDANLTYQHYADDTYDDDVLGGVDSLLTFDLVPERFTWTLEDNFGQITSDPFAADTPDNRENVNYLTTGPDLTLRLGGALSAVLAARYSNITYETSPLDGERYSGSFALLRPLSGANSLSLNVTAEQVEFDDTSVNTDHERRQGFLRYDARGTRTALSIDAGYTEIEVASRSAGSPLARLTLSRQMSAASTITLGAGLQYSDASDLFRETQSQLGVRLNGEPVIATSDPFESRFASLAYDFTRNRTAFGLRGRYGDENYESGVANDRTLTTWSAYFTRQMSRVLELRLVGELEDEQFENIDFEDQDLRLGAALAWLIGRSLEVSLRYDRYDRDSTALDTEYTENRVSLFLTWTPVAQR